MAFGQNQVAKAFPQPGTSNQPFAVRVRVSGGFLGLFPKYTYLPPFRPVKFSVAETNAAAVATLAAQVEALAVSLSLQLGQANIPGTIINNLAEINSNLARIAEQRAALASALQKLTVAVGVKTVTINNQTQILTTKAANQIQFNNFFKAYNGEKPELPKIEKQLEELAKQAIEFNDQVRKISLINDTTNSVVNGTLTWVQGTAAYQTVEKYFSDVKDKILAILPDSLRTTASKLKTGKASP